MKKLILLVLLIPSFLVAQKVNKKQKNEILTVCKKHIEYRNLTNNDSVVNLNDWTKFTSLYYASSIQKKAFYYNRLYNDFEQTELDIKGFYENDTTFGCELLIKDYDKLLWIDVQKIDTNYKVVGMNGGIFSEREVLFWDSLLLTVDSKIAERELVKNTVKTFFEGMYELYTEKNPQKLSQVTTKNELEFFIIDARMDSLKEKRKRRKYIIKEFDYVQIYGDSADCRTILKGHGGSRINLIKREGKWIVTGENGSTISDEKLEKKRVQEKNFYIKLKIQEHLKVIDSGFRDFMINDNPKLLQQLTSKDCFTFFENFKTISGDYNPKMLKIYGLRLGAFLDFDIEIMNDTAIVESLGTTFNLLYQNNQWILNGISDKYSKSLNYIHLIDQFENIKNSFRFTYSVYNLIEENESTSISITSLPTNDELDTLIYEPLEDFNPPATYNQGTEELFLYLSKTSSSTFKNSKEGTVFISFVVERDGSITNCIVHKGLNSEQNNEALRITKSMTKWNTAKHYGRVTRSRQILPIQFTK